MGNWGHSISIASGTLVWDIISSTLPRTLDLMIIPMIIAVVCGIILGNFLTKRRGMLIDKLMQLGCIIGLSLPIFFLGMFLQYWLSYLNPIFPSTGYKNINYEDPPFVTGFYIIDSLISGQLYKIDDYLYHLILPVSCLIITTFSLITIKTRSYIINQSRDKSVSSNTVLTGFIFGFIFLFTLLVEIIFQLNAFYSLFLEAIGLRDYWVFSAILNIIVIKFVIVTLISNIAYSFYKFRKRKNNDNEIKVNLKEEV